MFTCLSCSILFAQPGGFNRIYDSASIGNKFFFKIFVDQDTILAMGVGYPTGGGPQGVMIAKIDSSGNLVAQNFIIDSLNDFLTMDFLWGNIIKTSKNYYAFPATALGRGGHLLIQIDINLQVMSIFEYSIGNNITEFDEHILELPDGGFFIAGKMMRPNYKDDGFIRRIDNSGNLLWFKYYGDYNKDESFRSMVKITENRFLVSGGAGPDSDNSETARAGLWVIDSNGVILDTWLGPEEPDLIIIRGLLPASDGGFIAHGRSYWGQGQWGSKVQISLMKFDSTLQLEWLKHIGPSSSNYNGIYDMIPTPDGHYIVAGQRTAYGDLTQPSSDWGGWLYKFSEQGDSIWARADNAPSPYSPSGEFAYGGVGLLSSGSVVAGGIGNVDGKFVGWVVKVTADGCLDTIFCNTISAVEPSSEIREQLKIWPNPANEVVWIESGGIGIESNLQILDAQGRIKYAQQVLRNPAEVDISSFPVGIYTVLLNRGDTIVERKKFAIVH